jgi:hypothetical protein
MCVRAAGAGHRAGGDGPPQRGARRCAGADRGLRSLLPDAPGDCLPASLSVYSVYLSLCLYVSLSLCLSVLNTPRVAECFEWWRKVDSYDVLLCLQVAFFRDISRTASQQRQLYAASAAVGIGECCALKACLCKFRNIFRPCDDGAMCVFLT